MLRLVDASDVPTGEHRDASPGHAVTLVLQRFGVGMGDVAQRLPDGYEDEG